ncbi:MAG TPA: GNAT family N-acetyltransferase [Puia sp.]|nr:GNAT family N-acetyltransferase [Puia sp.]
MIRHAASTDLAAIRRLIAELDYAPPVDLEVRLKHLMEHPDEVLLVYERDGEVIAFLSLHFIPQIAVMGDFARISYFAVDGTARGGGIGRLLEEHITALARERGCDRIEVHCHTRRTRAHRFYERQGYAESPKYLHKSLRGMR